VESFEEGERVIIRNDAFGSRDSVDIIKEITKGGNYKTGKGLLFNKDGKLRGSDGWHTPWLEKYTEEKFKEIHHKNLTAYLKNYDWEKLDIYRLSRIWEITKEEKKHIK